MPRLSRVQHALTMLLTLVLSACGGGGGGSSPASAPSEALVTLQATATGAGRITSDSPALDCGTQCRATMTAGTTMTLTARPQNGSAFTSWGGACRGSSTTCTVAISSDTTVSANFAPAVPITVGTTGNGKVVSTAPAINCPGQCSATVGQGATVVLSAVPQSGHVLSHWSGACSTGAASCTVVVNNAITASATFAPIPTPAAWSAEQALSGAGAGTAQVVIDQVGRALAVWLQADVGSTTNSLWGARYEPAIGWGTPVRLEDGSGDVTQRVKLSMEPSTGRAVLAWPQLGSSGYDLWAKTLAMSPLNVEILPKNS